jgi:hypothetical protein
MSKKRRFLRISDNFMISRVVFLMERIPRRFEIGFYRVCIIPEIEPFPWVLGTGKGLD